MTPRLNSTSISAAPMPTSAHKVIPGIEQRTGAKFDYVPILLGGVFKLTNNQPPMVAVQGHQEQAPTTRSWRSGASSRSTG